MYMDVGGTEGGGRKRERISQADSALSSKSHVGLDFTVLRL